MKYLTIYLLLTFSLIVSGCGRKTAEVNDARLRIVVSFFPMEQFAVNIVGKTPGVEIKTLLPPDYGCPHDYYLTPKDMSVAAWGNVFIINGLGLEEFTEKVIRTVNKKIEFIDASEGIVPIVGESEFFARQSVPGI